MPKDLRTEKVKALLNRGEATMHELLATCYGAWPLNGLVLTAGEELTQQVLLQSVTQSVDNGEAPLSALAQKILAVLTKGGSGSVNGPRALYINTLAVHHLPRLLGRDPLITRTAHEATHVLQGDYFFRANETFEPAFAKRLQGFAIGEIASDRIANRLYDDEALGHNGMLTELFHRARVRLLTSGVAGMDYFRKGSEVQARLTEIMIAGYPVWGRMPGSMAELHLALTDAGCRLPQVLATAREQTPCTGNEEAFITGRLIPIEAIHEIQIVGDGLPAQKQLMFWQETVPMLYADLIEMMGDGPGRERFGFGKNPMTDGSIERIVPGAYTRPSAALPS